MSKPNMAAFRVPAELHGVFNQAVAAADCDKTAWLLVALRIKLNQPDSNPQMRMLELVERMEVAAAALAGGKQGITPTLYNEAALIGIVTDTIREWFDNGRVIAERLNEAGYQSKAGKAWDKDIYSAWKRQGRNADKLGVELH
ncbi:MULTISPECIES: hypothetical protein [Klebsiella pneumoniae complex]|uniref:hypothetical protein n=1 Tax=Klebsiella pneumoniae complex TaxID=3390273 RepID=UPI0006512CEB|nr:MULTISPECIES: hypothetical protein [Klebsiella]ANK40704.1 hypothetical protein WM91_06550 [Klebsiella pneumoniae]EIX9167100.1 hypothetical protein [Klebsiella pneumoniae]EKT0320618.1 hypothetical protein [Klebsiella pneumoniae]ELN9657899.1 hypothetical protein [Klebsiella variicola]MBC5198316.1 hypothetical protein [Klebsiella pneumoniae]